MRVGVGGVLHCPSVCGGTTVQSSLRTLISSEVSDASSTFIRACCAGRWAIGERTESHACSAIEWGGRRGLRGGGNGIVVISVCLDVIRNAGICSVPRILYCYRYFVTIGKINIHPSIYRGKNSVSRIPSGWSASRLHPTGVPEISRGRRSIAIPRRRTITSP